MTSKEHIIFMKRAIEEAKRAASADEVPIGAVAVLDGEVIMRAHNVREMTQNILGHAEILLLDRLSKKTKSWRLEDIAIYVTCEPCPMCAGALLQARISQLVYGCRNFESGACGTVFSVLNNEKANSHINVIGGILEDQCAKLLSSFFKMKRQNHW